MEYLLLSHVKHAAPPAAEYVPPVQAVQLDTLPVFATLVVPAAQGEQPEQLVPDEHAIAVASVL